MHNSCNEKGSTEEPSSLCKVAKSAMLLQNGVYFPFFLVTDSEKAIIALSISTGDNLESNN